MTITDVAKICYEANRAYCQSHGDNTFVPWDKAPEWQKGTVIKGIQFRLANPGCGAIEQHNSWMQEKIEEGWIYGEEKDSEKKTHPCLVPYEQLSDVQKIKDDLFMSIVDVFENRIDK